MTNLILPETKGHIEADEILRICNCDIKIPMKKSVRSFHTDLYASIGIILLFGSFIRFYFWEKDRKMYGICYDLQVEDYLNEFISLASLLLENISKDSVHS